MPNLMTQNATRPSRTFLLLPAFLVASIGVLSSQEAPAFAHEKSLAERATRAANSGPEILAWYRYLCLPLPEALVEDESGLIPLPDPSTQREAASATDGPCLEEVFRSVARSGLRLADDLADAFRGTEAMSTAAPEPTPAPAAIVVAAPAYGSEVIRIQIAIDPDESAAER